MIQSTNKFFTPIEESENRYYDESFDPTINPENNYVALLSPYIHDGDHVLDLGCAQGRFSTIYKNKKCEAVGIELDEKAAEYAVRTQAYKDVFLGDMTLSDSDAYKNACQYAEYDKIIMTDILEHVVNPTEFIKMYYNLLKVGGQILVSVPNFANIKVAMDLLNNQIAYEDMGILDNTHIKWYTKISFVQWIKQMNDTFEEINFDCKYVGATVYRNTTQKFIIEHFPELYEILANNENLNSFQLLFILTKEKEKCEELKKLINEKPVDVVDMLGNALSGRRVGESKQVVSQNERYQYEKQISDINLQMEKAQKGWNECAEQWQNAVKSNESLQAQLDENQKGWNECAEQWQNAVKSNETLQKQLEEARKGWEECASNWKAAVDSNNVKSKEISEIKKLHEEREEKLKQKIDSLYARIDILEASINPIMERDMQLQKENNELREKGKEHDI